MYSFNVRRCTDCGSYKLIENAYEITCTECGLVILSGMWTEEVYEYDIEKTNNTCRALQHIIDILNLPGNVAQTAQEMFEQLDKGIKGRHKQFVQCACVYYAQKYMNSGSRTLEEIGRTLNIESGHLLKASTFVHNKLFQLQQFKYLFTCSNDKQHDTLYRDIEAVRCVPKDKYQDTKKVVSRLYDLIKDDNIIKSMPIQKINVALIYIASKILNIKVSLKEVGIASKVSTSTILKVESIVGSFMKKVKTSNDM